MKKAFLLTLTALMMPYSAFADSDNLRIARLEQQVAELSRRIQFLEQQNKTQRIVIENRQAVRNVYTCRTSPFGKTYEAASENEGLARLQVSRACKAEQSEIFCRNQDIKCEKY
ncbi:hypothetical protein [Neisseria sp. S1]|uniref:hypothetical protein n=1 Tax=Neisseria sp. S1 TaxID=3318354 RepID=UPI003A8AC04B